jgi:hypothetical protein
LSVAYRYFPSIETLTALGEPDVENVPLIGESTPVSGLMLKAAS